MPVTAKPKIIQEFDGLRGLAAMAVVLCHLQLILSPALDWRLQGIMKDYLPSPLSRISADVIMAAMDGTFAVWVFWVLSGFVLSLAWFRSMDKGDEASGRRYLYLASLRRYPRLAIPVAISQISAYAIFALGLIHTADVSNFHGPEMKSLDTFYQFAPSIPGALLETFWRTFFDFRLETTYNSVLWTMEKELWGSLFVFAMLALVGNGRARYLVYAVATLVNFALGIVWLNSFVFGLVMCDLWMNPIPIATWLPKQSAPLLRLLSRPIVSILTGYGILGAILTVVGEPATSDTVNLLTATGLCLLVLNHRYVRTIFRFPFALYLGKISFGLYLIHFPIVCSYTCWLFLALQGRVSYAMNVLICTVTTTAISIAAGHLLYLIADRPSISLSKHFATYITRYDSLPSAPETPPKGE